MLGFYQNSRKKNKATKPHYSTQSDNFYSVILHCSSTLLHLVRLRFGVAVILSPEGVSQIQDNLEHSVQSDLFMLNSYQCISLPMICPNSFGSQSVLASRVSYGTHFTTNCTSHFQSAFFCLCFICLLLFLHCPLDRMPLLPY